MPLWKLSLAAGLTALLLAGAMAPVILADTPQIDSEAVRRVAAHIACRCGSCKDTVACPMSMQGCGFCVPSKTRIVRMQKAGFSDQAIIDSFIKDYGPDIYRAGPNSFFWLVPYGALVLGAGAILWFIRRYYKVKPSDAGRDAKRQEDVAFVKYRETIEKEVGRFDS